MKVSLPNTVFYYRPQTEFAKVMFSQVSVCLSMEGVSAPLHAGIHPLGQTTPLGRHPPCSVHVAIHTPLPSACWDTHPSPLHSACWDTVNKRAIRILLECNLVVTEFRETFRKNSIFRIQMQQIALAEIVYIRSLCLPGIDGAL